jgi:1-deoxy-D-xylulose-5-phosphate synthase
MLTFFNLHFCWWNGNCKPNGMKKKQHIAIIGDASMQAGMAFEGLNHAELPMPIYWYLNDNAIELT